MDRVLLTLCPFVVKIEYPFVARAKGVMSANIVDEPCVWEIQPLSCMQRQSTLFDFKVVGPKFLSAPKAFPTAPMVDKILRANGANG